MSRVYQCDKCKRIFEPRVLQNGEPYIARKGKTDLDLCPECYGYLIDFLKEDIDECKCSTCKYKGVSTTRNPCKECCHAWDDMYEEAEDELCKKDETKCL